MVIELEVPLAARNTSVKSQINGTKACGIDTGDECKIPMEQGRHLAHILQKNKHQPKNVSDPNLSLGLESRHKVGCFQPRQKVNVFSQNSVR